MELSQRASAIGNEMELSAQFILDDVQEIKCSTNVMAVYLFIVIRGDTPHGTYTTSNVVQ